jgi:hypothetical protein
MVRFVMPGNKQRKPYCPEGKMDNIQRPSDASNSGRRWNDGVQWIGCTLRC